MGLAADRYDLPAGAGVRAVLSPLESRFSIRHGAARRFRRRYFDSFDWGLFGVGLTFARDGDECHVRERDGDRRVARAHVEGEPRFWWDFPESTMRDVLRKPLGVRALLPLGELGVRVRPLQVLNRDDKTVVRLIVEEVEVLDGTERGRTARTLLVQPLRGYRKEVRKLRRELQALGFERCELDGFELAARSTGRTPGDYSSRLDLKLDRSMTVREAALLVFHDLHDTMERNVEGLLADLDTEFLHDFRVAVRRTRSALSQIRGVVDAESKARFGSAFKDVGRLTNRLRDLDVYLLRRAEYESMVPHELAPGLTPIFSELQRERDAELERVRTAFADGAFRGLSAEWRAHLDSLEAGEHAGDNAEEPVVELAGRFIRKRFDRVLRDGGRIGPESPDAAYHALRIDCKKLRYLLEFFSSLYEPDEVRGFVKQLKKLQDNLGDFNDLSVQQQQLRGFLGADGPAVRPETAAAVGALIGELDRSQHDLREAFAGAFSDFASEGNRRALRGLVAVTGGVDA